MLDRVEGKRVVSKQVGVLLHVGERGLGALSVALDRSCLAETRDLPVPHLHEDDLRCVARLARDDEGLGKLQRRGPGGHLHPGYTSRPAPVAQGIERAPPERKVAGSIPARRTFPANAGEVGVREGDCENPLGGIAIAPPLAAAQGIDTRRKDMRRFALAVISTWRSAS